MEEVYNEEVGIYSVNHSRLENLCATVWKMYFCWFFHISTSRFVADLLGIQHLHTNKWTHNVFSLKKITGGLLLRDGVWRNQSKQKHKMCWLVLMHLRNFVSQDVKYNVLSPFSFSLKNCPCFSAESIDVLRVKIVTSLHSRTSTVCFHVRMLSRPWKSRQSFPLGTLRVMGHTQMCESLGAEMNAMPSRHRRRHFSDLVSVRSLT